MTTTMTPDLLAHVAAVRDGACDDNELLVLADGLHDAGEYDREELIRVQVELGGVVVPSCDECGGEYVIQPMSSYPPLSRCGKCPKTHGPFWGEVSGKRELLRRLRAREYELLARNPAWLSVECPECPGSCGRWLGQYLCTTCNGTGDLLKDRATITRGFLDVTLPHTLCWRLEGVPSTRCPACRGRGARAWHAGVSGQGCGECGNHDTIDAWHPHPVLRAILASPVGPWVRRVRVEGREPYWNGSGHCRYDVDRGQVSESVPESANLPTPVFQHLLPFPESRGRIRWKDYPTREAAADALSLAVPRWARGEG